MEIPVIIQGFGQIISFGWKIRTDMKMQQLQEAHQKRQTELLQARIDALRVQKNSPIEISDVGAKQQDIGVNTPEIRVIAPNNEKPYSNYLADFGQSTKEDVSVGCVPCTRRHLSTVDMALKKGDVAKARREMSALLEYDLTPEKLANTPAAEREVLAKYRGEIEKLQHALSPDVPDITVAAASVEEAQRFARKDGAFHPEVQLRLQRAEDAVNTVESIDFDTRNLQDLSPEEREQARKILSDLRETRQKLINHVETPEDVEQVSLKLIEFDEIFNPAPEPEKVQELSKQATELNKNFRQDVIQLIANRSETHE